MIRPVTSARTSARLAWSVRSTRKKIAGSPFQSWLREYRIRTISPGKDSVVSCTCLSRSLRWAIITLSAHDTPAGPEDSRLRGYHAKLLSMFVSVQVPPFRMAVSGLDCWLPVAFGSTPPLIFASDSCYARHADAKQFKNANTRGGTELLPMFIVAIATLPLTCSAVIILETQAVRFGLRNSQTHHFRGSFRSPGISDCHFDRRPAGASTPGPPPDTPSVPP